MVAFIVNGILNLEGSARNNGFGWSTTAQQVIDADSVDMTGKNVLITGANSGIGKETAIVLARSGANIYMACRDKVQGAIATEEVRANAKSSATVECIPCDLSSLESVRQCAKIFLEKNVPLHVLILNAGVMACPYEENKEGFELQMATNYFGHFLLTNLLLDRIKEAQPSKVIVVSSAAHRLARYHRGINFEDMNGKGTWYTGYTGPWLAYAQSKAANILFALELSKRLRQEGCQVDVNALHPGVITTNLRRHLPLSQRIALMAFNLFSKTTPQGAATTVFLAASPRAHGINGKYLSDCNIACPEDFVSDHTLAQKLWDFSEKMLGIQK